MEWIGPLLTHLVLVGSSQLVYKCLVTPIYKPFGRGTTLFRGRKLPMVINHGSIWDDLPSRSTIATPKYSLKWWVASWGFSSHWSLESIERSPNMGLVSVSPQVGVFLILGWYPHSPRSLRTSTAFASVWMCSTQMDEMEFHVVKSHWSFRTWRKYWPMFCWYLVTIFL